MSSTPTSEKRRVEAPDEQEPKLGDRRGEEITLRDKLVGAALWGVGAAFMAPTVSVLTLLQQKWPAERFEWLSRFYCFGSVALTGSRWRAVVHPDVDPAATYMFAQNHVNHFDNISLYRATPHFKQGLELETHFKYPFYGPFMRSRGTIPVPVAKEGRFEIIRDRMRREVDKGRSILVFPEGTRTLDGRVGKFRMGVFRLAREMGLPIVPVAVTGMYDVMRKGSWIIRPGHTVTVYVEKPLPTAGLSEAQLEEVAREARRVMSQRVDDYFRDKYGRGSP